MKTLNFVILFALSIFLISNASAVVLTGLWQNNASTFVVNPGNSVSFTVDFGSMNPPTSITESLYNSNSQVVWQNSHSGLSNGFITDTIPASSLAAGSYQLIINGNDAKNFPDSDTLTLVVNSNNPPVNVNHPPVVSVIPSQTVNGSANYSYSVIASDPDGNSLFYSLSASPSSPSWLSINSLNGLIIGTAPNVSSDTVFTVTVRVSDGINSTSQSYNLTVRSVQNQNPNPFSLQIQFVSPTPSSGSGLYQNSIPAEVSVTGSNQIANIAVHLYDSSRSLVMTLNPVSFQLANFTGLSPGTYYINATAFDILGNSSSTETRTITLFARNNVPTYSYNDVYQNYNSQFNTTTKPGITIEEPQTSSASSFGFLFILFEILLVLVLIGLIILVFARRKFRNQTEVPKDNTKPSASLY